MKILDTIEDELSSIRGTTVERAKALVAEAKAEFLKLHLCAAGAGFVIGAIVALVIRAAF